MRCSLRGAAWWFQLALGIDSVAVLVLLAAIYVVDPGIVPPSTVGGAFSTQLSSRLSVAFICLGRPHNRSASSSNLCYTLRVLWTQCRSTDRCLERGRPRHSRAEPVPQGLARPVDAPHSRDTGLGEVLPYMQCLAATTRLTLQHLRLLHGANMNADLYVR